MDLCMYQQRLKLIYFNNYRYTFRFLDLHLYLYVLNWIIWFTFIDIILAINSET